MKANSQIPKSHGSRCRSNFRVMIRSSAGSMLSASALAAIVTSSYILLSAVSSLLSDVFGLSVFFRSIDMASTMSLLRLCRCYVATGGSLRRLCEENKNRKRTRRGRDGGPMEETFHDLSVAVKSVRGSCGTSATEFAILDDCGPDRESIDHLSRALMSSNIIYKGE